MLLQRWVVHPTHPLREFSPQTAQELLPECLIYHMAIESFDRLDLSYFVVRAWVDDPNEVPMKMLKCSLVLSAPTRSCMSPSRQVSALTVARGRCASYATPSYYYCI
ncbi:hypothetical protein VPH35_099574 [Triticum aestivum]|uniref:Uncharacterized protein n=1 Tax=Aegilops tauschii subsp. strangulata TaxID=200361 RepID=A0A453LMS3_AEGTS